jgi:hypothetical protein
MRKQLYVAVFRLLWAFRLYSAAETVRQRYYRKVNFSGV